AALIGIDEYGRNSLHGCVSDARSMEKYLVEDLGVLKDRIQLLLGSEDHASPHDPMYPSRKNITDMLLGLSTNDNVQHGDNILIYYAGHGSCYSHYEDDEDEDEDEDEIHEYIEALCPIDRDALDENGKRVPDISDRELNTILSQISLAKGERITLILDCCYSG
ncbi:peptidase C14, caspase domain-containing protein, partial [Armillaria novae-zelandiae]